MKFKNNYQKYLEREKITYKQYLESSHWQKKKEEFKNSKYYKGYCWVCGDKKNLHLHHKTYEKIGREMLCDFLELCPDCHNQLHLGIKNYGWPLLRAHEFLLEKKEEEQILPPTEDEVEAAERRGKLSSNWKWKRPKKLTPRQKKKQRVIEKREARKRRKCVVCGRWTGKYNKTEGLGKYCSVCKPQPYLRKGV